MKADHYSQKCAYTGPRPLAKRSQKGAMQLVALFYALGTITLPLTGVRLITTEFAVSDTFYLIALIGMIYIGTKNRKNLRWWVVFSPYWLAALLIFIGGLLSSIDAVSPSASLMATFKSCFVFSFWISMGIILAREGYGRWLLAWFLAGAVFAASVAVLDKLTGLGIGPSIYKLTGNWSGFDTVYYNLGGRYPGPTAHPNILAHYMVVAIPILFFWILQSLEEKKVPKSALLGIALSVLLYADLLTGSVAGMLVGLFSLLICIIAVLLRKYRRNRSPLLPVIILLLFSGGLSILIVYPTIYRSMGKLILQNENLDRAFSLTGPSRMLVNTEAWRLILKSPWVGYGMDQGTAGGVDPAQLMTSDGVHNALLRGWFAGGIFSFAGFLIVYLVSGRRALIALAEVKKGKRGSTLMIGLGISVICWIFIDMVQPSFYQRFTWFTISILIGLSQMKGTRLGFLANHLPDEPGHISGLISAQGEIARGE